MNVPKKKHFTDRRLLSIRKPIIDQATHHLRNFLNLITATSNRACSMAATPEDAQAARIAFFKLFGEVVTTVSLLDEISNPEHTKQMGEKLDELKNSDEYKKMMAAAEAERIAGCYIFKNAVPGLSVMHPEEWAFEVSLNQPCKDFGGWLLQKIANINGKDFAVMAVEYAPLKPPFKTGDKVRLVVREMVNGEASATPYTPGDAHAPETPCPDAATDSASESSSPAGDAQAPDGNGPGLRSV